MKCRSKMHFWYSAKQAQADRERRYRFSPYYNTFCRIDGKVLLYTECGRKDTPCGSWDDYIYLGVGEFDHAE